jgi:ankyrin repeat protein
MLLPDGKISCNASVLFEEHDVSPRPGPVEFDALTLEMQLIVSCSNVQPSAARVRSILSRLPPATVNLLRVPGVSFTLLEFAARNGQLQVIEVLLCFGADVSVQTPCLWAAYTGNIEIIEVLMQHGAVPAHERGFDGVSCSPSSAASLARSVVCEAYKSPVFSCA